MVRSGSAIKALTIASGGLMRRLFLIPCVIGVLAASGCTTMVETDTSSRMPTVTDPLRVAFERNWPDNQILVTESGDVNGDDTADLVVIFASGEGRNGLLVVLGGETPRFTNELPAPIENQTITLSDIDEESPTEFIVQGSKGASIGYAIYRVENGRLDDLFGEGMEDCC